MYLCDLSNRPTTVGLRVKKGNQLFLQVLLKLFVCAWLTFTMVLPWCMSTISFLGTGRSRSPTEIGKFTSVSAWQIVNPFTVSKYQSVIFFEAFYPLNGFLQSSGLLVHYVLGVSLSMLPAQNLNTICCSMNPEAKPSYASWPKVMTRSLQSSIISSTVCFKLVNCSWRVWGYSLRSNRSSILLMVSSYVRHVPWSFILMKKSRAFPVKLIWILVNLSASDHEKATARTSNMFLNVVHCVVPSKLWIFGIYFDTSLCTRDPKVVLLLRFVIAGSECYSAHYEKQTSFEQTIG